MNFFLYTKEFLDNDLAEYLNILGKVKFRYFEKATAIWPIFHFFLHYLESSNYKRKMGQMKSLFRISKLYPYKIVKIHSAIPIFHLMVYGKVLKRENIVYLIFAVILVLHICTCRLCSQLDSDKKTSSLHPFLGSPSVNCQTLTGRGRFLISFRNSAKKALCRILTYVCTSFPALIL